MVARDRQPKTHLFDALSVIVSLIASLLGFKGWLFWLVFLYAVFSNFFFQVRWSKTVEVPARH